MEKASIPQSSAEQKKHLNVGMAILVGQLVVTLPFVLFILAAAGFDFYLLWVWGTGTGPEWLLVWGFVLLFVALIIIGVLAGYLWYSFSVPRWRKWALQNGAPEVELQKWAAITGLVWPPKSWIIVKTIFRKKE